MNALDPYNLNTIITGDAIQVMRELPPAYFNAVITDPPYSSGTRREAAKGIRKSMTRETDDSEWFETDALTVLGFSYLMRACALEWNRVLKPGGHVLCFIDWRMYPHLLAAIESADLRQAGVLIWDKTYFGMGACFRNQFEFILHFTKGVGAEPQRRDVGNVLRYPPVRDPVHPTEKPIELMRCLTSVVVPVSGSVLDCFSGYGTTLVAAKEQHMNFLGIERMAYWVDKSNQRLKETEPFMLILQSEQAEMQL